MTKEYNLYRMNKINHFMVLVVAFFIILILTVLSSSSVSALATNFEDEEGRYLAEIPRVIESSKEDYVESFLEHQTEDYVPLPVRYMRNMKPVYDQRTSNACWAFAGVSLFEFAVERKLGNGKIFSFSAEHLVEKTSSMGKCGFTASIKGDGTESMVSSYFVSGYGPVSAADYPWRDDYYLIPDYSFGKAEYRATDIKYYLNERNSDGTLSSNIKQSVKEDVFYNGAVYFSMYMPNDSSLWTKYLGSDGKSYYVNDKKYTENNHAVLVVGWDDNYSKTNFKSKPKADGAWLVRNSWGSNVGDKGYYWISYEDTVIIPQITICGYEEMDDFKKVYNLDESGMSGELEYNTTEGGFINVFDIDNNEKIAEVTFFESSTTASYQIFYVPIKSDGIPDVSKKIAISEEKNIEYKGYHTVPIKQQIELNPGTKYGIMVYIRDRNRVSIGIEMTSNHTRATLNEGESFWCNKAGIITDEKSYGNAAWGNFSIKLVTVTPVNIFN